MVHSVVSDRGEAHKDEAPFRASMIPDDEYLLLTPGPLSTTTTVRAAMLQDWCTWDAEYNALTQDVRRRLVDLVGSPDYTSVLMQGSGTFVVEAMIGSVVGSDDKLLVLANGAYGRRIGVIAQRLGIAHTMLDFGDTDVVDVASAAAALDADPAITHVAKVHCETTTGALNPLAELCATVKSRGLTVLVDAMSSFGGVPIDVPGLGIDFLVSSANKCVQGVPGFGFVIARTDALAACAGRARSLSLDLVDQWQGMENGNGTWRFTSPTHVVHAFHQALLELEAEGGVAARFARYSANQRRLVSRLADLGLNTVIEPRFQSPVITAFAYPERGFDFGAFYAELKNAGFVIYPGKVERPRHLPHRHHRGRARGRHRPPLRRDRREPHLVSFRGRVTRQRPSGNGTWVTPVSVRGPVVGVAEGRPFAY